MCDVCHHYICPGSCPNADPVEEKALVRCALCSRPLEEGEEYFSVLDKSIHLDCGSERIEDFLSLLRIPVEDF